MKRSPVPRIFLTCMIAWVLVTFVACGASKVRGTYSNASGMVTLDLRSGGEASFTMMGETEACTYKVEGQTVHLTCGQNKVDFAIHDDGSLTGPGFIGSLKKSKS
jgi:hypothetical protein